MRRCILAALVVAAVAMAFAAPASAKSENAAQAAERAREAEHRRVVEYWTPKRMANAIPRDVVLPLGTKPRAHAKPGSGTASGDSGGTAWGGTGDVVLTTGKVFFTLNGSNYVCSGSAVDSTHGSLVLTAGHCLHDGGGGAFATNFSFRPAYNNGNHPRLGAWTATDLYTTSGWATKANWFNDDAGFAVVYGGAGKGTLEQELAKESATVNIPQIDTTRTTFTTKYYAFGYPAAGRYNGQTLIYCSGNVRTDRDSYDTLSMNCNMTGGSSGGPWFTDWNDTAKTGVLNSLNSYGYSSLKNVMFGPIFGAPEGAAYSNSSGTSGDCTSASTVPCISLS